MQNVNALKSENTNSVEETRVTSLDFAKQVEKYHRKAYNVAYRMTGNRDDAEDLCQDSFLRAYRFYDKYNPEMPFDSWLYKIMSNIYIDKLRRKPKFSIRSMDQPDIDDNFTDRYDVKDEGMLPEDLVVSNDITGRLMDVVNNLPDIFRQTIIYADIEMMSYEEIAEITDTNIGTVRSRLHRGRKLLRERLLQEGILDADDLRRYNITALDGQKDDISISKGKRR